MKVYLGAGDRAYDGVVMSLARTHYTETSYGKEKEEITKKKFS